jgi:hypothetical protein
MERVPFNLKCYGILSAIPPFCCHYILWTEGFKNMQKQGVMKHITLQEKGGVFG